MYIVVYKKGHFHLSYCCLPPLTFIYLYTHIYLLLTFTISAMCIVVTMEVLSNSVNEWNTNVAEKIKYNKEWDFSTDQEMGLAYWLAFSVVVIYIAGAIAFFIASHKQKGSRAATSEFEIEDRDIEIGR